MLGGRPLGLWKEGRKGNGRRNVTLYLALYACNISSSHVILAVVV